MPPDKPTAVPAPRLRTPARLEEHRTNDHEGRRYDLHLVGADFPELSIEHAIPEALACPANLVLRNVACARCRMQAVMTARCRLGTQSNASL